MLDCLKRRCEPTLLRMAFLHKCFGVDFSTNLVSLVGFCDEENETIAIYDYAPNGSLCRSLLGEPPTLSWKKRLKISIGVARGLHYLHSGTKHTIIHRDINSFNILLDENWVPKVTYFEIAVKGPRFSEKNERPKEVNIAVVLLELICGKTFSQICGDCKCYFIYIQCT